MMSSKFRISRSLSLIIGLLIISCSLFSCNDDEQSKVINENIVELRVLNQFNDSIQVLVTPFDVTFDFGKIATRDTSEYQIMNQVYPIFNTTVYTDTDTFNIQIIDYISETLLKNGKYLYKIDIDSADNLITNLVFEG